MFAVWADYINYINVFNFGRANCRTKVALSAQTVLANIGRNIRPYILNAENFNFL